MKHIYIFGGGTFNYVRNHLAIASPAFGSTARQLAPMFEAELKEKNLTNEYDIKLVLTKMADHTSSLVSNDDVEKKVKELIKDPDTKAIIFNIALEDFQGQIGDVPSGKYADRLKTSESLVVNMKLTPTAKIISLIREVRKDIFLVGFKTTAGFDSDDQYNRGLELLKKNSVNLVLANDTIKRNNMIIAPEETRYCETLDREEVLKYLTKMTVSRMQNHFTRSTVVEGQSIDWNSEIIPNNLREVVNHCIKEGAYKPFLGKTAGHFAIKINNGEILTSIRKTNYNDLDNVGLVKVVSKNAEEVVAHGFKPSVGGQSQRIIFEEHSDLDCIVHFHCPIKEEYRDTVVPVREQWPNECGSHECGKNTSDGLKVFDLGDGESLNVVYLDEHGPNIVFNHKTPAHKINKFIDKHFNLSAKTGGLI